MQRPLRRRGPAGLRDRPLPRRGLHPGVHGAGPLTAGALRIVEVGPRDGLQNEPGVLPTPLKLELVERLAAAGLPEIEVTSFVRPDRIPQLADAADLCAGLRPRSGTVYTALVPNPRGLDRAVAAGLGSFACFLSASEAHNRANLGRSTAESLADAERVAQRAPAGARLRAYVSVAFGCPFGGPVAPAAVAAVAAALVERGYGEVSLGDTIGVATPADVTRVLAAVGERLPLERVALHLHDTRGTALANVAEGYRLGVRVFDGSVAGLGGCPYAPGAAGNVATEDLVYLLEGMGAATGADLDALVETGRWLCGRLGRTPRGHLTEAGRRWWPGQD